MHAVALPRWGAERLQWSQSFLLRPEGWQRKEMHFNVRRTLLRAADISASRATINRGALFFHALGLSARIIGEDVGGKEGGGD